MLGLLTDARRLSGRTAKRPTALNACTEAISIAADDDNPDRWARHPE